MPLKNGHLTPRERTFAEALGRTGDAAYAGHEAGYRRSAESARVKHRPAVQEHAAKVRERAVAKLIGQGVELAVDTLMEAMKSPNEKIRVTAALGVLKEARSFTQTDDLDTKELHEMSAGELAAFLRRHGEFIEGQAVEVVEGEAEFEAVADERAAASPPAAADLSEVFG